MDRLRDLIAAIPSAEDRTEVQRLAREAVRDDARGPALDHMLERIAWSFRAGRYRLPTRDELERMIREPDAVCDE